MLREHCIQVSSEASRDHRGIDYSGGAPTCPNELCSAGQVRKYIQAHSSAGDRRNKVAESSVTARLGLHEKMADHAQVHGHEAKQCAEVDGLCSKLKRKQKSPKRRNDPYREHTVSWSGILGMDISENPVRQQTIPTHSE